VPGKSAQASIFHPLNLELDCFPAEEVFYNVLKLKVARLKNEFKVILPTQTVKTKCPAAW
jgi:hypothetical protein